MGNVEELKKQTRYPNVIPVTEHAVTKKHPKKPTFQSNRVRRPPPDSLGGL